MRGRTRISVRCAARSWGPSALEPSQGVTKGSPRGLAVHAVLAMWWALPTNFLYLNMIKTCQSWGPSHTFASPCHLFFPVYCMFFSLITLDLDPWSAGEQTFLCQRSWKKQISSTVVSRWYTHALWNLEMILVHLGRWGWRTLPHRVESYEEDPKFFIFLNFFWFCSDFFGFQFD